MNEIDLIIKGLECCTGKRSCDNCPFDVDDPEYDCVNDLETAALALLKNIKSQQPNIIYIKNFVTKQE